MSALKVQAEAGEPTLLFADEADASTHPYPAYPARTWARRGVALTGEAPGQAIKRALFGARIHGRGELIAQTAARQDGAACCRFIERLKARAHGRRVHLVPDDGPIRRSRRTRARLAAAEPWLTVEWLPAYAPELNDIKRDWQHLKCH